MLQPLNNLLRSDMKCEWSTLCTEAVYAARQANNSTFNLFMSFLQ